MTEQYELILTKEIAQKVLFQQSSIALSQFTTLHDDAAEVVASFFGDLQFAGLRYLSCHSAEHIIKQEIDEYALPTLNLGGLASIPDDVAECLGRYRGGELNLSGLISLPAAAASGLSRFKGELNLSGLTHLSESVAALLATHEGDLILDGVRSLCDNSAKELMHHRGYVSLGGVERLTDEAMKCLCAVRGGLNLGGLKYLSPVSAKLLSNYEYEVSLDLEALPVNVVPILQRAPGFFPADLRVLTDELAERCGNYLSELNLNSVEVLSDSVAQHLSRHKNPLYLNGISTLSVSVAKILSKHQGSGLSLNGLRSLDDEAAEALSSHQGKDFLSLDGLVELSPSSAASLGKHGGTLSLAGLTTLSDEAADGLKQNHRGLNLSSLQHLSDCAAEAISGREGKLDLGSIEELSDSAAASLSRHRGFLALCSVRRLSDVAAESLSKHDGFLDFDSLTEITEAGAMSLCRLKGGFDMPPLENFPPSVAAILRSREDKQTPWNVSDSQSSRTIKAAIEAIEAAFAEVRLGSGISIRQADAMDNYCGEEEQLAARVLDEHDDWRRISDDLITNTPYAMCFMDDAGILFHLPAYMRFTLRNYHQVTNMSADSATNRATDAEFIKRFKPLMTAHQRAATVKFLRAYGELEPCMHHELEEACNAWS